MPSRLKRYKQSRQAHVVTLHKAGATTIDGASYGYDSAGNRTSKTNQMNAIAESYSYDLIYQLTFLPCPADSAVLQVPHGDLPV